jgi:hypothetical protein
MKLVIYPSHFWDFNGLKLVIKTVNKLPQAEHLLVLEQSIYLALEETGVAPMLLLCKFPCTIPYSTCCWKGRYERNLAMFFFCGACNFPPCLRRLKSRMVWTLHHSTFYFLDPISEFCNFHKKRQSSSNGSLNRSSGICYLTKGFKRASTSYFYGLYMKLWVA